jgi:hypothetical protein
MVSIQKQELFTSVLYVCLGCAQLLRHNIVGPARQYRPSTASVHELQWLGAGLHVY